jgi:hypothetical protein
MAVRRLPVVSACLAASFVLSCHTITEQAPEPPEAPTAATHAPAAAPPQGAGCTLPRGTGSGNDCPREVSAFLPQVEEAMDQLIREEPHLFDLTRRRGCEKCYLVVDPDHFTVRMVEVLNQRGLCSTYDGEELGVKNTNGWNDQYDILTFEMYLRRENGSYRSTCYPAWF